MIELPPEIWHEILHYVPGHDILPLRLMSKYLDYIISQTILHHARQSKLRISCLCPDPFSYGLAFVSRPTYTSSSARVLLDERMVEYTFELQSNNARTADYVWRCFSFSEDLWNNRFPKISKWSFDFLQKAGSWSWTFHVFWRKGATNHFSVFFSNVSTEVDTCPRGEAITYWPKKGCHWRKKWNHVVEGVTLWATIKVPLKVLAHQFAGNLGEK
jgi:hypothetical protein